MFVESPSKTLSNPNFCSHAVQELKSFGRRCDCCLNINIVCLVRDNNKGTYKSLSCTEGE